VTSNSDEFEQIFPAATHAFAGPIPTQNVASEEYLPAPQTSRQRRVEFRLQELGDQLAKKLGLSRRRFFQTASGMAAAWVVMNEVYGNLFAVDPAEANTPELAAARADALKDQFIMDMHTHHLHEPLAQDIFDLLLANRTKIREAGWDPIIPEGPGRNSDLLYDNYVKEIFLDSDTKVALITSAPADNSADYFLSDGQMNDDRARTNTAAGSRRLLSHFILKAGQAGFLDQIDHAIEVVRPDSWKGYTIGDPLVAMRTGHISKYPWRLDDERVAYPIFERIARSSIRNVCIHKGLFPLAAEQRFPELRRFADVSDVGKAAKDWPQLNFIIYHAGYRHAGGGTVTEGMAELMRTGRLSWVSDLADIPEHYGVSNVYADIGTSFAETIVAEPHLAALMMGILIKGLGADHVVWGTDALWTGSPQWQIEGLRRLEIPEPLRKQFGLAPLGAADGPVKTAVFGDNSARLYNYQRHAELDRPDKLDAVKAEYERLGSARSNLRYGFVSRFLGPR